MSDPRRAAALKALARHCHICGFAVPPLHETNEAVNGYRYFTGRDPLGREFAMGYDPRPLSQVERGALWEIVNCDITRFPGMEAKLIEVANRISGMRGEPPTHPDPVMLGEWLAEIMQAGLTDAEIDL